MVLFILIQRLLLAIVFNVLLYTDFFGNDIQLHTKLPVKVDIIEIGNLHLNEQDIKVVLVKATTKIHFLHTPTFISKRLGIVMLIVILGFGYLTWIFKKFISNVERGIIFTIENIKLLKKLAYAIAIFWIFTFIYSMVVYSYIFKELQFESVRITGEISNNLWILFVALLIWVLAHIFMKGVQLQQEKDLTI